MSDLSYLRSAIQQQKSLQSNPSSQSQSKLTQPSSLTLQELTRIAQAQKESQESLNPNWYNKNTKRTIPGRLIKRVSAKASADQVEEDEQDIFASNLSSQTNKKILSSFRKARPQDDETYENDFTTGNEDLEIPPKRSIYDLRYDDDDGTPSSNALKKNSTDLINKDPMNFRNAFNSNVRVGLLTNSNIASSRLASTGLELSNTQNYGTLFGKEETAPPSSKFQVSTPAHMSNSVSNDQPLESAVLVFGYDDASFTEILAHFSKFGIILEDFSIPLSADRPSSAASTPFKAKKKTYPIFIGKSWVKLTYDNPASAIRACRESDLTVGNKTVNTIPYSKEVLEKFLDEKINVKDDIGDSLNNLNFTKLNNVPGSFETLLHDTPIMDPSKRNKDILFNTSIKIKDGEGLFVSAPKKTDASKQLKTGNEFLKKATDVLFGFNDI